MKCSFAKFITELFFVSEIHFYLFSQGCSDDLYGDSGEFSSPGYPDTPYPNSAYCMWRIKVSRHMKVQVTFEDFDLEEHCDRDQVKVYDGYYTTSSAIPVIGAYCSRRPRFTVESSSNIITVLFRSDLIRRRPGFKASYKAVSGGWFNIFLMLIFSLFQVKK